MKNDCPQVPAAFALPSLAHSTRLTTLFSGFALAFADSLSIVLASCLSGFFAWQAVAITQLQISVVIAGTCALMGFFGCGHYARRKPFLPELRDVFAALVMAGVLHMALLVIDQASDANRAAVVLWIEAAFIVPLGRIIMKLVLMRLSLWQKDVVIIGSGRIALDTATAIASEPLMGLRVRGFVPSGEAIEPLGAPLLRIGPENAHLLVGVNIMVALGTADEAMRASWLKALGEQRGSNVILVADMSGIPLHGVAASYVKTHDLLMLQVRDNLSRWHVRFAKRCLDLVGALVISLVLSPVLLFIAWQVRRDGGSAIYGHLRVGHAGRPFHCYKFRSMVTNANAALASLLERDPEARKEWERDFKLKNDPRVTRIGRLLRRTSLDELPQLWNVIRGDMSLVGPRPIVEAELPRYGNDASYYLMARPGMTGLWQVSGRNDADYATRVRLDGWYVRNWSLFYDIAILFKTARIVVRRNGAY